MTNNDCNCLIEKIKKGSYERGVPTTTKGGLIQYEDYYAHIQNRLRRKHLCHQKLI